MISEKFVDFSGDTQERVFKLVRPYITWQIWIHALEGPHSWLWLKVSSDEPWFWQFQDNPIFMKSFVSEQTKSSKSLSYLTITGHRLQSHKIGKNHPLRFYVYCVAISEYIDFIKTNLILTQEYYVSWTWMTTTTSGELCNNFALHRKVSISQYVLLTSKKLGNFFEFLWPSQINISENLGSILKIYAPLQHTFECVLMQWNEG